MIEIEEQSPPQTSRASTVIFFTALTVAIATVFITGFSGAKHPEAAAATQKANPFASISVEAQSAYVVDLMNGRVLYQKNADAQRPLASLTKAMLMEVVAQFVDPNSEIKVSHEAVTRGEGGGPDWGEVWKAQKLEDYTLIASSNVGAEALSEAVAPLIKAKYLGAPEEDTTIWYMNARARQLGLSETFFSNPSGLDISSSTSGAYGSARDMGTLFGHIATSEPDVLAATTKTGGIFTPIVGKKRTIENTNEALPVIPGLILGKTGLTDLAGGNLVVVFDVGPSHPVAAVVLGSTEKGRFSDIQALVKASRDTITSGYTK